MFVLIALVHYMAIRVFSVNWQIIPAPTRNGGIKEISLMFMFVRQSILDIQLNRRPIEFR